MKTYTLAEVVELQNKRQQLEQRIAVHKQRAAEKQNELSVLFAENGVSSIQELSEKCAAINTTMQVYAENESATIAKMKEYCDGLDRML